MTTYVIWYEDLWGWDTGPGASRDDFLRELEIGWWAMVWERMENTSAYWFETLAYAIEHDTVVVR